MITQILDGGKFDDIKAVRVHKITDGGGFTEVSIKDLTKDELMDIARTYYLSLQELGEKMKIAREKIISRNKNHYNENRN
jgi:hypothetical protein